MDTEVNDSIESSKTHSPLHELPFLPYNSESPLSGEEEDKSRGFRHPNETSKQQFRYSPLPTPSKLSTSSSTSSTSSYSVRGSTRTVTQHSSSPPRPPPPVIQVSYGCLLLPVFLAAWWYYTKSVCKKVAHGFIRSTAHTEQDELETYDERFYSFTDCYAQWEDSIHQSDSNESTHSSHSRRASDRFVKWINRSNVHRRFQRKQIEAKTNEYLYGRTTNPTTEEMSTTAANDSNHGTPKNNNDSIEMTVIDANKYSNHNDNINNGQQKQEQEQEQQQSQWECLPDVSACYCILQLPPTVGGTGGSGEEAIHNEVGNSLLALHNSHSCDVGNGSCDNGRAPATSAQLRRYHSMPVGMSQQQLRTDQQQDSGVGTDIIRIQQLDPKGIVVNNCEHSHHHHNQNQQYPRRSVPSDRGLQMKGFPALADGMMT